MTDPRVAARMAAIEPFRVVEVMEAAWALEAAGQSVVWFCVGEPDFGTPSRVVAAAGASTRDGHVHYTGSLGIPELREAISDYYARRLGAAVAPGRIVVTTGASGALLMALAATLDPGREIVLADPGYPCNRSFVRLYEGTVRGVPVDSGSNYQLTAGLVESAWTERTGGVLLATPSNPTGTVVPPAELTAIADTAAARGGVLYVDEIYGELVYDRAPSTVLGHTDDAFVINSFSKTFGMTGWRLGWLVTPEWALDAVRSLAQNMYISPPAPAQYGALAAFTPEVWDVVAERRHAFQERRDVLVAGLRSIGFGVPVQPEGAFYVYADISAFDDDSAVFARRVLQDAGVAVTPGCDFGRNAAERHVRFSYTTSLDQVHKGLDRLAAYLT
ncbi:MAG TPA: aminotransferase class I/II-fold pyridoxal phosphate-dependent enzyme [Acidimicrobiales bacterium]